MGLLLTWWVQRNIMKYLLLNHQHPGIRGQNITIISDKHQISSSVPYHFWWRLKEPGTGPKFSDPIRTPGPSVLSTAECWRPKWQNIQSSAYPQRRQFLEFYGGLMAFNGWMGFYGGLIGSNESNGNFNGIWLVVYLPLWKICESQLSCVFFLAKLQYTK